MRVLVACEYSGSVRDARKRHGHNAWSCDLLPSETPGNHYLGDVRDILGEEWDLMIAHPPCTYLSYAANRYWNEPGRAEKRKAAMSFFMEMVNAPVPHICIENPVGLPGRAYRKPDQIIHPYFFGDRQLKRTCLWLKGLPPLWYWKEDDLFGKQTMTPYPEPMYTDRVSGKKRYFTDGLSDGHARSRTFPAIAEAMAAQWGAFCAPNCN